MSQRGILWRVLGDDPELWQSAEAWSVVADLCEQEGYGERARLLRELLQATAPSRWNPRSCIRTWCALNSPGLPHWAPIAMLADTDRVLLDVTMVRAPVASSGSSCGD